MKTYNNINEISDAEILAVLDNCMSNIFDEEKIAKIVFKGPKFSIHDNKNVTCNGKEITNEELERMLNKSNFKL